MLTGFTIIHREKEEEDHVYWERISKLSQYKWIFRKTECSHPNCTYCNDPTAPGQCLIFTFKA